MSKAEEFIKLTGRAIYEMASLQPKDTNTPVKIWIDERGINRKAKHNIPRIKIEYNNKLIPISLESTPRVLIKDVEIDSRLFSKVSKWIILNLGSLLKHWNQEYSTRELFMDLKKI